MVGEQYRDLIDAADTIVTMSASSSEVMGSINKMQDLCTTLQHGGECHPSSQPSFNLTGDNLAECPPPCPALALCPQGRKAAGCRLWHCTTTGLIRAQV